MEKCKNDYVINVKNIIKLTLLKKYVIMEVILNWMNDPTFNWRTAKIFSTKIWSLIECESTFLTHILFYVFNKIHNNKTNLKE